VIVPQIQQIQATNTRDKYRTYIHAYQTQNKCTRRKQKQNTKSPRPDKRTLLSVIQILASKD
jgi:hypothetical protein